jgi:hypothetical protein
MKYIQSYWYHNNEDPICLLYEIDDQRLVERIIEIYKNGRAEALYKENDNSIENVALPCVFDINHSKEFLAFTIDENEFGIFWDKTINYKKIDVEDLSIKFYSENNVIPKAYKLLKEGGFEITKETNYLIAKKGSIKLGAKNIMELLGLFYLLQEGWKDKSVDDETIVEYVEKIG